jgi:hypothetical protein
LDTTTPAAGTAGTDFRAFPLPGGLVRVFEPVPASGDLGRMYVMDVFGMTLMIREREDGMYVAIDHDGESDPSPLTYGPLGVEVNSGGEAAHE